MQITKEGRHEYSKKRRKLVRKGLNPYDDKLLTNLDKEWAQLRVRIDSVKNTSYGTLILMNDFEDRYYSGLGINSELDKILYEVGVLKQQINDISLLSELNTIMEMLRKDENDLSSYLNLKRAIVKLQAVLDIPTHFYEALDDEYRQIYQELMTDTFKTRK